MLHEELGESGHGNVEGVGAIVLLEAVQLGSAGDAAGLLEGIERGFRVGIDVVGQDTKGLGFGVVDEASLLEEEGEVVLATDLSEW